MRSSRLAVDSDHSTPGIKVVGNDDLLTEILKRLPVLSLLRFKSVSKNWLSLITTPHFSILQNPNSYLPSGFFLPSLRTNQEFDFVPLDAENPIKSPFRRLSFAPHDFTSGITILSSSNGLLCCGSSRSQSNFYVYNPCNKNFAMIPRNNVGGVRDGIIGERIIGVNLAFDPSKSKSAMYKVICVVEISKPPHSKTVRIEIYSSDTGEWKHSDEIFIFAFRTLFNRGVYLNGAIHWISRSLSTYYFNVDQERIEAMPMPPFSPKSQVYYRYPHYFGESLGHLHLIETYGPIKVQFNVFEMERDCSGWFVRYRVDLNAMLNMYPEMILDRGDPMGRLYYGCFPLYVLHGERNEDSYAVLHIPGKIVRYNFVANTFKLLFDFDPPSNVDYFLNYHARSGAFPFIAFPFIASLSCV